MASFTDKNIKDTIEKCWILYAPEIRDLCRYKLSGDTYRQEDVLQKAFLALSNAMVSGQNILNPKAWLYKTTRNLIYTEYANMQKAHKSDSLDDESSFVSQLAVKPDFDEERISSKQIELCYNQVLSILSKEEQNLIEDIYVRKRSVQEISMKLGIKTNTLQQRLVRLRRKIKQNIQKILDEL